MNLKENDLKEKKQIIQVKSLFTSKLIGNF